MLDIKRILSNAEEVEKALAKKGCNVDFKDVKAWDGERRARIADVERMKAERNKVSAEIPKLKKEGKDVSQIFAQMRALGGEIESADKEIAALENVAFQSVHESIESAKKKILKIFRKTP